MHACHHTDEGMWALVLIIGGCKLEIVDKFVYLASLLNSQNNTKDEIRRRLVQANRFYYVLK